MIRWDFVSNSSSTCSMFPKLEDLDPKVLETLSPALNTTWHIEPVYSPEIYDYYVAKLQNKKFKVYFRMKPSSSGIDSFPRFIEKIDIEYDTLKEVMEKFPTAIYCTDECDVIRKVFEKEPLKHVGFSAGGEDIIIDSEPIRKLIGDEEYDKVHKPENERLDYQHTEIDLKLLNNNRFSGKKKYVTDPNYMIENED